jgi:hypothetical protein
MPKQVVLISTHCFGSTSNLKTSFEKVLLYIYLHLHQIINTKMSEPAPTAPLRAKHTRISFEDGAAPSALPSILKNKKVRQAPINRARDTICKALESLELVSEEKKNDLATTITNHFKAINKKRTVLEKFQDDFIPKPLRINPPSK